MGGLSTLGRSRLGQSFRALADRQRAIRAGKKQEAIRVHRQGQADELFKLNKTNAEQTRDINAIKLEREKELQRVRQSPQHIQSRVSSIFQNPMLQNKYTQGFRTFVGDPKAQTAKTYMLEEYFKTITGTKEGTANLKLEKQEAWAKTEADMEWLRMNFKPPGGDEAKADIQRARELKELYKITDQKQVDIWQGRAVEMQTALGVKENLTAQAKSDIVKQRQIDKEERDAARAALSDGKDTRTTLQKEFDRFKDTNKDWRGNIVEFEKYRVMMKTNPVKAALGLAGKDMGVITGTRSLEDAAKEYYDVYQKLIGGDAPEEELPFPDPKENSGKTIRDTKTNKRYKSNGKKWVEILEKD